MYKIKKIDDGTTFEFDTFQYYDFKVMLFNEQKKEQLILPAFMTANFKSMIGDAKNGKIEFAIGEHDKGKKYIMIKKLE